MKTVCRASALSVTVRITWRIIVWSVRHGLSWRRAWLIVPCARDVVLRCTQGAHRKRAPYFRRELCRRPAGRATDGPQLCGMLERAHRETIRPAAA
jgi:hypothetical protein